MCRTGVGAGSSAGADKEPNRRQSNHEWTYDQAGRRRLANINSVCVELIVGVPCILCSSAVPGVWGFLPVTHPYIGDKEQVAAEAAKLRIANQLDGFTAVGTPLASAEYVSNALGRRSATVETLVDTLVQLPLSVQSQFLLLSA